MKLNPRVQAGSIHLFGAAVAGPALVISGLRYPGSFAARAFLAATGAALIAYNTRAMNEDLRPLLKGG